MEHLSFLLPVLLPCGCICHAGCIISWIQRQIDHPIEGVGTVLCRNWHTIIDYQHIQHIRDQGVGIIVDVSWQRDQNGGQTGNVDVVLKLQLTHRP